MQPNLWEPHEFRLSSLRHNGTVTQSSSPEGGEIWWGGLKLICGVYLRCSVLCGTVETFATGKSIHHLSPLLTDFNVTGPHALVLNVSFHYWREFLVNQSVNQPTAWHVRHLLHCPTIWVMTQMMTYSRKCHSVSPQLPPALLWDWWDSGELLYKWPSRQMVGMWTLPVNNRFILVHVHL